MRLWETIKKCKDGAWAKALNTGLIIISYSLRIVKQKWWFGRKALMRGVSTEYTGEPAKAMGKELFGFCMKVQM